MDKNSSNARFIADRITKLRLDHNISEYKLSLDLGFSKGYIQAISSGNIIPSLDALYRICDFFQITPAQFFAGKTDDSRLLEDLISAIRELSAEEQYTLYHFLKGGKLPSQIKVGRKKSSSRESQAPLPEESDK